MPAQRKVSLRQTEILLSFLEAHRDLAKGRVSQQGGPLGKQTNCNHWDRLAEKLNCCGSGATKSAKEWKVYWNNIKYKVRSKASDIRRHMSGTGGGPALDGGNLTPQESRILAILGKESVFGEESVRIPFPENNNEVPVPAANSSQEVLTEEGALLVIGAEVIATDDYEESPEQVLSPSPAPAPEDRAPEARAPEGRAPEARAPTASAPTAPAPVAPAPVAPALVASVQQVAPARPYIRRLPDIPAWAREMEDRHIAAQERTVAVLEELLVHQKELLAVQKEILRFHKAT